MGYDAFGKPRNGDDWSPLGNPELNFREDGYSTLTSDITKRGFTDHEHLDNFELIHMNGRMYDFNNGRFLSVDPFIQGVTSQAINPYSYIQNNPLSGTDPTGYMREPGSAGANLGATVAVGIGALSEESAAIIENGDPDTFGGITDNGVMIKQIAATGVSAIVTTIIANKSNNKKTSLKKQKGSIKVAKRNGGEKQESGSQGSVKGDTSDLKNRADEVHGKLDKKAQDFRTTAAVDKNGNKIVIVSSSEKRLSKQQRESLKDGEIEGTSKVGKEHAEVTGIRTAKEMGLTPTATAASRPICQNCQKVIKENNVKPKSPLKKPPKKKLPKPEDEKLK